MASFFEKKGLRALAVHAETSDADRQSALERLRTGEINVLFAKDLFNEGLDVPAVDTVLFLRPTESATVFLQQLGRGLRLEEGKDCLTVLDFIGNAHARFRFVDRFQALSRGTRRLPRIRGPLARSEPSTSRCRRVADIRSDRSRLALAYQPQMAATEARR